VYNGDSTVVKWSGTVIPSAYAYAKSSPYVNTDREVLHIVDPWENRVPLPLPFLEPSLHNHCIGPKMCKPDNIEKEECKKACDAAFEANITACKMMKTPGKRVIYYDEAQELYSS
jgi:hypothetical protein